MHALLVPDRKSSRHFPSTTAADRSRHFARRRPSRHATGGAYEHASTTSASDSLHGRVVAAQRVTYQTSFVIELGCLLCGRAIGLLESKAWPSAGPVVLRLPRVPAARVANWQHLRCSVCGGNAVSGEVTTQVYRNEKPIDWEAERPRRGRPPKALVEARRIAAGMSSSA